MGVTNSGGASVFANKVAHFINTRCKAQLAVWLLGSLYFYGFGNSLIIGPAFNQSLIKSESAVRNLVWILDSTSSPVCILIPFSGWEVYIMGLMHKEFEALALPYSDFETFLRVIPFQFYALGTLFMIPIVAFLGYEFAAMYKAETRAVKTGELFRPGSHPARPAIDINEVHKNATSAMILVPLLVLIICVFGLLAPYGFPVKPVPGDVLRAALCTGFFLGAISCIIIMVKNKVCTWTEGFNMLLSGAKEYTSVLIILIFAWTLGSTCKALGTANYIVSFCHGTVPGFAVPALLFIIGASISFATGSSWSTFAILIPLAVPMSVHLNAPMYASIGAVLSGGLFGDHCSPISDTTMLSAIGAACDLIDHVKTQLPYALTVALASIICYLLAGILENSLLAILMIMLVFMLLLIFGKMCGKKIPNKINL